MKLELFIAGIPAPQGSKTAFISKNNGRAGMKESSKRNAPWRRTVLEAVKAHIEATGWEMLEDVAVCGKVTFYFPRPAAAKNRSHPHKVGPGDIDKLQRSLFDALTNAGVWKDDAQLCELTVSKLYAPLDYQPGVRIEIESI